MNPSAAWASWCCERALAFDALASCSTLRAQQVEVAEEGAVVRERGFEASARTVSEMRCSFLCNERRKAREVGGGGRVSEEERDTSSTHAAETLHRCRAWGGESVSGSLLARGDERQYARGRQTARELSPPYRNSLIHRRLLPPSLPPSLSSSIFSTKPRHTVQAHSLLLCLPLSSTLTYSQPHFLPITNFFAGL